MINTTISQSKIRISPFFDKKNDVHQWRKKHKRFIVLTINTAQYTKKILYLLILSHNKTKNSEKKQKKIGKPQIKYK